MCILSFNAAAHVSQAILCSFDLCKVLRNHPKKVNGLIHVLLHFQNFFSFSNILFLFRKY